MPLSCPSGSMRHVHAIEGRPGAATLQRPRTEAGWLYCTCGIGALWAHRPPIRREAAREKLNQR